MKQSQTKTLNHNKNLKQKVYNYPGDKTVISIGDDFTTKNLPGTNPKRTQVKAVSTGHDGVSGHDGVGGRLSGNKDSKTDNISISVVTAAANNYEEIETKEKGNAYEK